MAATGGGYTLAVTWEDGQTDRVDLADVVDELAVFTPLREAGAFDAWWHITKADYESGERLIPKHIGLACIGYDMVARILALQS